MTIRIYWPLNVIQLQKKTEYPPSLIIGWNNSDTDIVVVTTLPFLDPAIVETLLIRDDLLKESNFNCSQIYERCGIRRMSILGTLNVNSDGSSMLNRNRNIVINARLDNEINYPQHELIGRIKVKNINEAKSCSSIQVIVFDPPLAHRMQYLSLYPISLALAERTTLTVVSEEYEANLIESLEKKQILMEKALQHTLREQDSGSEQRIVLKNCISQVNCSHEVGEIMRHNAATLFPKLKSRRRRLSVSESVIESARTVHDGFWNALYLLWCSFIPYLSRILVGAILLGRVIAEGILSIIEWRPGTIPNRRQDNADTVKRTSSSASGSMTSTSTSASTSSPPTPALKDISATAQQIDLRLQQFCYWPIQYLTIRKRSQSWHSNTDFNVEYIRFYNTIWLVINDVILGVALGSVILDNRDYIVDWLCYGIDEILSVQFRDIMLWLMDWPGGLKLNNELAAFFGEMFLWVIQFWATFLNIFRPYFRIVISVIGYAGFGGFTLSISLVSDFISFLTLHVYAFYVASARIYHWQLVVLHSLFHLFRGKKHNVLRNRIDSCNYELDQLLMGTVFFTVLIFLLPTVLVFYLFFAFSRLSIVLLCAGLESVLSFLNHFPLFAILLRIKDSQRIPGGIRFEYQKDDKSCLKLKSVPLGYSHIFQQYNILGQRLRMHYLSLQVITRLLTGQFVPIQRTKLYVLLYSMLPEERVPLNELYKELKTLP
ncbi:Gpi1p [Sugiyamaella lignohabitans]|uniref:Gpi1p n=1 Tax=Sugiyamaella lignohabitans TaxID=796027 RepID=A0A161HLF7_9ASCO|nr:Gpi1p [Sugiyamaella lignohabitans]ANB14167.1 Gpi1p [Sugiyamaella lignohabitans]